MERLFDILIKHPKFPTNSRMQKGVFLKRTKIIATAGPSTDNSQVLARMLQEGVDVIRMNLSHGSIDEWEKRLQIIRESRKISGKDVPVLLDTKGPEIRTGYVEGYDSDPRAKISLKKGTEIKIVCDSKNTDKDGEKSTPEKVYITYEGLSSDISEGQMILLDDGTISTRVKSIEGNAITVEVLNSGSLGSRKGVNVPNARLNLPSITDRDKADLLFGIQNDFDFIAASFVRKADDVLEVRKVLNENNGEQIKVISKIENREGIDNLDEIITVSDGIMVARGDMGVEIPPEEVPVVQDEIIRKSLKERKIVIIATHMLNSMIDSPRPTRAEVSDVYNAVKSNSSAVMLSGETASGSYPEESVKLMSDIASTAEKTTHFSVENFSMKDYEQHISLAITSSAVTLAEWVEAKAIVAYTESGITARHVSSFNPKCAIIGITPNEKIARQMHILRGVIPVTRGERTGLEEMFENSKRIAEEKVGLELGDSIVVLAGTKVGFSGSTNTIRVVTKGDVIARGNCYNSGDFKGRVKVAYTAQEANENIEEGEILAAYNLTSEYSPAIEKAGALLVSGTNYDRKAIEFARKRKIPILTDIRSLRKRISNGTKVQIIGHKGVVLLAHSTQ